MIALVLGDTTPGVVSAVERVYGRRDVIGFKTLTDLMHSMQVQKKIYNRIVCSTQSIQNETYLASLHQYLTESNLRTEVVFLARVGFQHELNMVDIFHRIYHSGIYTDVVVNRTTDVQFVRDLFYQPIDELRMTYSSRRDEKVTTMATYIEEDEEDDEIVKKAPHCLAESGVLKVFSFGGKFFGRRRFTKQEQQAVRALVREADAVASSKLN